MFGYTVEEALGRNISELIVPDGHWDESERLKEALRRGERVDAELARKRKDGRPLVVSFVAAPVVVNGGAPEIYGIYRDITERKRADEALRRSEAYLAEGQRLSHTGSWARCVATGDIFFSQESFRIFGLDPVKTRMTLDNFFASCIHPEFGPRSRPPFKRPPPVRAILRPIIGSSGMTVRPVIFMCWVIRSRTRLEIPRSS